MEEEKKRKRGDRGGGGGERRKRRRAEVENEVAQPSEEEVEEFFTILRRMDVAVKYFEKTGSSNVNHEVNGDGRKMKELAEDGVNGVKSGGKRDVMVGNSGLDLNTVPEAEG